MLRVYEKLHSNPGSYSFVCVCSHEDEDEWCTFECVVRLPGIIHRNSTNEMWNTHYNGNEVEKEEADELSTWPDCICVVRCFNSHFTSLIDPDKWFWHPHVNAHRWIRELSVLFVCHLLIRKLIWNPKKALPFHLLQNYLIKIFLFSLFPHVRILIWHCSWIKM